MCLWFDSCLGRNVKEDYGDARGTAAYQPPAWNGADHGQQRNGSQGQGYHGNGHKASHQMAADEAACKAHNDARKYHVVAAATRDGHGGYPAYAQDKAYTYSPADETLKRPSTLLRAC